MFAHLNPDSSDFGDVCAVYAPFLHQLTMQSSRFEPGCPVLVVVCVARKLRPCPSYSRVWDRINLGLWRSLYKGGGGVTFFPYHTKFEVVVHVFVSDKCLFHLRIAFQINTE